MASKPGARSEKAEPHQAILVVGGGLVGRTLAERLASDGHDVTLVEKRRDLARELTAQLGDVRVVCGNGATAPTLRRAGIEQARLVLATTGFDEANLVIGLLASSFGVPGCILRVLDSDHARAFQVLKGEHGDEYVSVNPIETAVAKIANLLAVPGSQDVCTFFGGELLVVGFRIPEQSDFADLLVRNVDLMFADTPTLVAAIQRGREWIIPSGEQEMRAGDIAYFAVARRDLAAVLALLGARGDRRKEVIVAGATPLGLGLCRRLERSGTGGVAGVGFDDAQRRKRPARVTLIEEDEARAKEAQDDLEHTLVVCGRVTDQSLLEEEEVEHASTFVAATEDHETNLVAALLAKRLGAHRAFAMVDNPGVASLVSEIGIDAPIVPRQLVIDMVLGYVRGKRVFSVATLLQEGMEAFEGEVAQGSVLCSGPIREVAEHLPGALVVGVRHGEELLVPRGDFRIQPGDHVVIITTNENVGQVGKLLSA